MRPLNLEADTDEGASLAQEYVHRVGGACNFALQRELLHEFILNAPRLPHAILCRGAEAALGGEVASQFAKAIVRAGVHQVATALLLQNQVAQRTSPLHVNLQAVEAVFQYRERRLLVERAPLPGGACFIGRRNTPFLLCGAVAFSLAALVGSIAEGR